MYLLSPQQFISPPQQLSQLLASFVTGSKIHGIASVLVSIAVEIEAPGCRVFFYAYDFAVDKETGDGWREVVDEVGKGLDLEGCADDDC